MTAAGLRPIGGFLFSAVSALSEQFSHQQLIDEVWPASGKASVDQIRALYRLINLNKYDPYPVDWTRQFSPIERMAWSEIRYRGLPFWPQFPIGRFFADFADPKKKIVIECDGKAFHDPAKDLIRDRWMTSQGWAVFRINGADCNRVMDSPWEVIAEGDIERGSAEHAKLLHDWHTKTVDGLMSAIASYYYSAREPDEYVREALMVRLCGYARGLFHGAR